MEKFESKIILNAQEVSEYLRISLSTVHHLTRSGKLRSKKIGNKWCYKKTDLDYYLEYGEMPQITDEAEEERRIYKRFECHSGCVLKIQGESDSEEYVGYVLNYSRGGVLFEFTDASNTSRIQGAKPMKIKVSVPNAETKEYYEWEGTVVHFENANTPRAGIQFKSLEDENLSRLSECFGVN